MVLHHGEGKKKDTVRYTQANPVFQTVRRRVFTRTLSKFSGRFRKKKSF